MNRSRLAPALLGAALVLAALTGCAPDAPETLPTSAPPSPSESATPSEEPAAVTLPTDCDALGTDATREAVVGALEPQPAPEEFPDTAPASAELALGCAWFAGDATGLAVMIGTAPEADVTAAAAALPAQGFTCTTDDFGATVCELVTPRTDYPVDAVDTIVAREGVWISMSTSNLDGTPLLSEIVDGIFGITQGS